MNRVRQSTGALAAAAFVCGVTTGCAARLTPTAAAPPPLETSVAAEPPPPSPPAGAPAARNGGGLAAGPPGTPAARNGSAPPAPAPATGAAPPAAEPVSPPTPTAAAPPDNALAPPTPSSPPVAAVPAPAGPGRPPASAASPRDDAPPGTALPNALFFDNPAAAEPPGDGTSATGATASAPLFPLSVYVGTAIFGGLLVLMVLMATLLRTTPFDETQQPVIRTALALGSACVAVLLPGAANIKVGDAETTIGKAASEFSGPMAFFFLVFLFYKPHFQVRGKDAKEDGDTPEG